MGYNSVPGAAVEANACWRLALTVEDPRLPSVYIHSWFGLSPHGAVVSASAPMPRRTAPHGLGGRSVPLPPAGWIEPIPRPERWIGRPVRFTRLDRLSQLALVAAHGAAQRAGCPDPSRGGVALGTAFGSHLCNEVFLLQLERGEPSPALFTYTLPSSAVGEISIHLGLRGPGVALTQGVGAGLAALALAAGLARRGEAPWMLAGAADTLSPTLLCAAGEQGGELAEGAAFFVLTDGPARALARLAGTAGGGGDLCVVEEEALGQAGLHRDDMARHLVYRAEGEHAHLETLGRSAAAAPMLGLCSLVEGAELPALISVEDRSGAVDAVCVTAP